MSIDTKISLDGWDIGKFDEKEWAPWGSGDKARAKVIGVGRRLHGRARRGAAGYRGDPHVHEHAEFSYVIEGTSGTRA